MENDQELRAMYIQITVQAQSRQTIEKYLLTVKLLLYQIAVEVIV
jgi:hypothetical protein